MKKTPWHLPRLSTAIGQVWVMLISPIPIFEIYVHTPSEFGKSIILIALISLTAIQIFLLILSFFLWNKPLYFNECCMYKKTKNGIIRYCWDEAVSFKLIAKWYSPAGPSYVRFVICYKNGFALKFEPNSLITKEIKKHCR